MTQHLQDTQTSRLSRLGSVVIIVLQGMAALVGLYIIFFIGRGIFHFATGYQFTTITPEYIVDELFIALEENDPDRVRPYVTGECTDLFFRDFEKHQTQFEGIKKSSGDTLWYIDANPLPIGYDPLLVSYTIGNQKDTFVFHTVGSIIFHKQFRFVANCDGTIDYFDYSS